MVNTITLARCTGASVDGDPTFGAQFSASARVEYATKFIPGSDGNQVQCEAVVASRTEIRTTDRIWLPGDNVSSNEEARRAITVKHATTPSGDGFFEAYL